MEFLYESRYKFNNEFTGENATCMIIGDDIIIYAVGGKFFKTLIKTC